MKGFDFRPYQEPAIEWISRRRRGLVKGRAGCGKTIIAAAAIYQVYHRRPRTEPLRVGWLANTIEQTQQAHAALDLFNVPSERHVACAAGEPDFDGVDVLVVDEAHHATCELWDRIISRSRAKAAWMFTATPHDDNEEKRAELLAMVDGEIYEIPPEEVAKQLAHGRVILLSDTDPDLREPMDVKINEELCRLASRMLHVKQSELWQKHGAGFCERFEIRALPSESWEEVKRRGLYKRAMNFLETALKQELWPRIAHRVCLDMGIAQNEQRNAAIIRAVMAHPDATKLVLVNNKDHGGHLAESVPGAVVCHSKMGVKRRRDAMACLRDGSLKCAMLTSLADEGLDVPIASILVMACGGRSARAAEQRTGRVLRSDPGKVEGLIYDFTDAYVHPLMAKQSKARQAVYARLNYTIETPTQKALL